MGTQEKSSRDRPGVHGMATTTPSAAGMIDLLGVGNITEGLGLTRDEFAAVRRLYRFTVEQPNPRPPEPERPKREAFKTIWAYEDAMSDYKKALERHAKWVDPQVFMQAGSDRNTMRHAARDGLRLLAWLARFVPAGTDPLKAWG